MQPLTPPDCDLQDFPFMPIDAQRLLKSDTWILGNSDEKAAAITLWIESWHQVPAASLPANDRVLAKFSQAERWNKSKAHALRGWVECSDGRLYHPVVAEKALEAWIEKLVNSYSGMSGNSKRWGVQADLEPIRAKIIEALEMLRRLAPASRTFKKKSVTIIAAGSPPDGRKPSPPDSGGDRPPISPPDSPPDRKGQGQGQGLEEKNKARTGNSTEAARADVTGFEPTSAGVVCRAMRDVGIADVNPGHPTLLELLAAGAQVDEFVGAARTAVDRGKGFAYAIATVQGQREDAAKAAKGLHRGPLPPATERAKTLAGLTGADRRQTAGATPMEVIDVDAKRVG